MKGFRRGPPVTPHADRGRFAAESRHPAWAGFVLYVLRGGDGVRRDLLDGPGLHWRVVWDVYRAGYEAGRSG